MTSSDSFSSSSSLDSVDSFVERAEVVRSIASGVSRAPTETEVNVGVESTNDDAAVSRRHLPFRMSLIMNEDRKPDRTGNDVVLPTILSRLDSDDDVRCFWDDDVSEVFEFLTKGLVASMFELHRVISSVDCENKSSVRNFPFIPRNLSTMAFFSVIMTSTKDFESNRVNFEKSCCLSWTSQKDEQAIPKCFYLPVCLSARLVRLSMYPCSRYLGYLIYKLST